jgi:hypothetical protein
LSPRSARRRTAALLAEGSSEPERKPLSDAEREGERECVGDAV